MAVFDRFEAITLVTENLETARAFYRAAFDAACIYEDAVCAMFEVGPVVINLLSRDAAHALTAPAAPGRDGAAPRTVFTLRVQDVDAVCVDLAARGVAILDGPADRPWGRRTATFGDPSGHVWEIAQVLPGT